VQRVPGSVGPLPAAAGPGSPPTPLDQALTCGTACLLGRLPGGTLLGLLGRRHGSVVSLALLALALCLTGWPLLPVG
jgi:hypothetical protein